MIAVQGPKAIEAARAARRAATLDRRHALLHVGAMPRFGGVRSSRQPHRLHGRRRLSRSSATRDRRLRSGTQLSSARKPSAAWPPASAPATRSASKPPCRSTATSFREAINPIQAGLNFAVNLEGREFIGREALERFAADKSQPVRVGLQLDGKRVAARRLPGAARRRNRRRSHERHVLADVRPADRDGLRPTHRRRHRHPTDRRHPRHPAPRRRRPAAVLPTRKEELTTETQRTQRR